LDIIEVMACPGGCIGGAGQPVSRNPDIRKLRTRGLYDVDKNMELHKSQENHFVTECYQRHLGEIGGRNAHRLLHTHYQNRRRIAGESIELGDGDSAEKLCVNVCTGTTCFLKGSQHILHELLDQVEQEHLQEKVSIHASFCFEQCNHGPTVSVDGKNVPSCTPEAAKNAILQAISEKVP
ncbi:MAG: iron hydrogenase small subunit, partial [Verrucomicrobiota bacterium]